MVLVQHIENTLELKNYFANKNNIFNHDTSPIQPSGIFLPKHLYNGRQLSKFQANPDNSKYILQSLEGIESP